MKEIYKTSIFNIQEDTYKGNPIVRIDSPNWVNILGINKKNEILFIRQYRHGTQNEILETPGGLIDEKDASPLEAAKRELLEETGYSTDSWEEYGWLYANPAYQNNKVFFFVARDIDKTSEQNLDCDEEIFEVFFEPISKVKDMLKNGEINHSIIYANLANFLIKNE